MPIPLVIRQKQRFRPSRYTSRHRLVAELIAAGMRRTTVAQRTGYSRSHISRIVAMPEVRQEINRLIVTRVLSTLN